MLAFSHLINICLSLRRRHHSVRHHHPSWTLILTRQLVPLLHRLTAVVAAVAVAVVVVDLREDPSVLDVAITVSSRG